MSAKKPKKRAQLTLVSAVPTNAGLQGKTSGQKTEYGLMDKLYARIESGKFADPKVDDPKYDTYAYNPLWDETTTPPKKKQRVAKKTPSPRKKKTPSPKSKPKPRQQRVNAKNKKPLVYGRVKTPYRAEREPSRSIRGVPSLAKLFKEPGMAGRKSRAKYTAEERKELRRRMMMDRWGGAWAGKVRVRKRQSNMSAEARIAASKRMKANWRSKWSGKRRGRMVVI